MNFNLRTEIIPDKLKLPHTENGLFSPNLYRKCMPHRSYVLIFTVQRSKVEYQYVHVFYTIHIVINMYTHILH